MVDSLQRHEEKAVQERPSESLGMQPAATGVVSRASADAREDQCPAIAGGAEAVAPATLHHVPGADGAGGVVSCLTLRSNTERPATVELGTNELIGDDLERAERSVERIVQGESKQGVVPPLWDGRAVVRLVDSIEAYLEAARG